MNPLISKDVVFLIEPVLHWAFLLLWIFFRSLRKKPVAILSFFALSYFCLVCFSPLPRLMMTNLEHRSDPVQLVDDELAAVVLSGGTFEYHKELRQYYWQAGADRFLESMRILASPQRVFIFTGRERPVTEQTSFLIETESMVKFMGDLHVANKEIVLEAKARSTRQNAENVQEILNARGLEKFYLVTSAFHMARAMQVFRAVGLEPIPFPVDFYVRGLENESRQFWRYQNLPMFRLALHEYLGMIYYRLLGLS